ncbi:SpoIID/LytB domain-containing protein [Metabacillus litoralis]|uniref:Modulator protein n=1 Tax=Metabacillus litoralis TaxID=152268 RepID=A0A179SMB7_9BACI|nr:SpoIID/LytB domain-containing protein [Metabacillus litoralis]OAS82855.1 modulator protein [Metabacillus litoralis]
MRYFILIFVILFTTLFPKQFEAEEMIKVKLVNYIGDTDKLNIVLEGGYQTLDPTLSLKEGVDYHVTVKNDSLYLQGEGKEQKINGPLVIIPETYDHDHAIYVNNRPYLGAMEFRIEENVIRPINQLPIEDYLKGVVPFEVFPSWHQEALKAQSLAARTYAYSHTKDEMDDTIHFQVYGGYNWNENTTKAVEETNSEVITFDNHLIDAFYSASNGGVTENNTHVWGGKAMSYFPIKKDPFDPTHPWEFTIHRTQISMNDINWDNSNWWDDVKEKDEEITLSMKKWLQNNGYPGDIKIVSIPRLELSEQQLNSKRTDKGSITVEFLHRLIDGTVLFEQFTLDDVKLNQIRPMIGGNQFKSYLISSLECNEDTYTMKGKGYGHGVGMSQWGANFMGESGKTYKEIIQFYYPGTLITTFTK